MNDSFAVRRFERLGNLTRVVERSLDGQRPAQGLALDQFQHQAIYIAGFFQSVDGRDIGMIQRSQRTRLAAETGQAFWITRELGGQGLDGDIAAEFAHREPGIPRPCRPRPAATKPDTFRIVGPPAIRRPAAWR